METRFINVSNGRLYKRNGKTRHHLVSCTYCDFKKFKLLKVHFNLYHPGVLEKWNKEFAIRLSKGQIGEINGIRFITSDNVKQIRGETVPTDTD